MLRTVHVVPELSERPGFVGPDLSPQGLELRPRRLGDGVYALLANIPPKDNNGLVVGAEAALVVDAGVTPQIGKQIQRLAARLTDRPIAYLANTTFHGDHTFGNAAFPQQVIVVSSRANKAAMDDLDREKRLRGRACTPTRPPWPASRTGAAPDVAFDQYLELDLGGRTVELWHFGPGNGPGDVLVHVPDAKVAWTGNFLGRAGIPPMLLIGDPVTYTASLRAMRDTLDVDRLVPGHGFMADARPATDWMLGYLERLWEAVSQRRAGGQPLEAMLEEIPLWDAIRLPPFLPRARRLARLIRDLHRLNILATHQWLQRQEAPGTEPTLPAVEGS
jgi:cyclase